MGRQEWTANRTEWFAPSDIIFDFKHMYISRRGDTVGPPVWKSTILHILSKSELSILEAMAVRVPMMYVAPSTPSHAKLLQGIRLCYFSPGTPPMSSVTHFICGREI